MDGGRVISGIGLMLLPLVLFFGILVMTGVIHF